MELPGLTQRTMLMHAQPLMVELPDEPNSFVGYNSHCKTIKNKGNPTGAGSVVADYYTIAGWRACIAQTVPEFLIDMPHSYHTMTLFGTNNMMAIITNTLIITAAFAIAGLPAVGGVNVGVPVAQLFLLSFFIVQITVPLNDR